MLMEQQCHVVLGTDSLASNQRLSILEEMRSLNIAIPSIPLEKLFHWATASGATALGIADRFGSFEKGKTPGVLEVHKWQPRRLI
jgi:cytosine/adenosine deaminase-related metal-dependent hydrolase